MMRILRKGERYVLNKPNEKSYFLSSYIRQCMMLLTGLFCFQFVCFAQSSRLGGTTGIGEIKPLIMGQRVPDQFWTREHLFYVKGDTIRKTLEEYRGKYLIFDFWATWCGACVKNMPKLFNTQSKFEESLVVILVNKSRSKDSIQNIDLFFKNRPDLPPNTIIEDQYISDLFPHKYQPFYVWLDNKGEINAFTYAPFINYNQIERFIYSKQ